MTIPALQDGDEWAHDSCSKANLLAKTFASKFVLPQVEANEFSVDWPERHWDGFVLMRSSFCSKALAKLDIDSGTGPDGIAARVLKLCARELGRPLAKLVRRIISESVWPRQWRVHWLLPLHKRKSKSIPGHYRAINLTAQISKAVERLLCPCFLPRLDSSAFGDAQFAYRKEHGARDAVLFYVLCWIAVLDTGSKFIAQM